VTRFLQRLLVRAAAIAAILFGAMVTLVLAFFTLLAGLVIGLFLTLASWLGMRPRAPRGGGWPGTKRAGRPPDADQTVIDIEMREIERPGGADRGDAPAAPPGRQDPPAGPPGVS
jgi:hypothetical protein